MYLAITVRVSEERYSHPYGEAEMILQVEYDNAANLEFGNTLQGAIQVALNNLVAALHKEKDEA